jgi:hypothetical protein
MDLHMNYECPDALPDEMPLMLAMPKGRLFIDQFYA